jgi:hypothetical protein
MFSVGFNTLGAYRDCTYSVGHLLQENLWRVFEAYAPWEGKLRPDSPNIGSSETVTADMIVVRRIPPRLGGRVLPKTQLETSARNQLRNFDFLVAAYFPIRSSDFFHSMQLGFEPHQQRGRVAAIVGAGTQVLQGGVRSPLIGIGPVLGDRSSRLLLV